MICNKYDTIHVIHKCPIYYDLRFYIWNQEPDLHVAFQNTSNPQKLVHQISLYKNMYHPSEDQWMDDSYPHRSHNSFWKLDIEDIRKMYKNHDICKKVHHILVWDNVMNVDSDTLSLNIQTNNHIYQMSYYRYPHFVISLIIIVLAQNISFAWLAIRKPFHWWRLHVWTRSLMLALYSVSTLITYA